MSVAFAVLCTKQYLEVAYYVWTAVCCILDGLAGGDATGQPASQRARQVWRVADIPVLRLLPTSLLTARPPQTTLGCYIVSIHSSPKNLPTDAPQQHHHLTTPLILHDHIPSQGLNPQSNTACAFPTLSRIAPARITNHNININNNSHHDTSDFLPTYRRER